MATSHYVLLWVTRIPSYIKSLNGDAIDRFYGIYVTWVVPVSTLSEMTRWECLQKHSLSGKDNQFWSFKSVNVAPFGHPVLSMPCAKAGSQPKSAWRLS